MDAPATLRWRHGALQRLALFSLAFALAVGGQGLLNHDRLWAGALLYGVALLVLLWTAGPAAAIRPLDPLNGLTRDLQVRRGMARELGLVAVAGALTFSLLAYRAFDAHATRAWGYYLAGLAYLLLAALLLAPGGGLAGLWPRTRLARWLLVLVFVLALAMRLWQLGDLPAGTWYDEAISGLQGIQWIADPAYRPQFQNNNPGQLVFLYATALRWFGHGTRTIRLVPAAMGLAGVLAAYLLGSELRGPRFGLAMAFWVAVARWHVNFSRIAMPGVDTPLFGFLSLFFLTRLLRGGRLRDAVGAGVALGLGLSVYSAFRLFVLAVGLFACLSLCGWRAWRSRIGDGRAWLRLGARLGALGLALWLTALPVIHYSLDEPAAFWGRVRSTSLLNRRDEPDLVQALGRNTLLHVLMFNVNGDRNGRHNLYGEPTLDPAMGVLFVLGLGLALARIRQPANLFFAILLPVGLLGGILSLDFEAPQSLRSIAAMPAVIYFCALSLTTLLRRLEQGVHAGPAARLSARLAPAWRAFPVLALGGYVLLANAQTYFIRQANDTFSWSAFSAAESLAGQRMAELGPGYGFYLSPLFGEHPSIRFLSPETDDRHLLALPDALPVRRPADRPVALFIHPDDRAVVDLAHRLYPAAGFETLYDPAGRTPVLYVVTLTRADIAQVQGLELRTWHGQAWPGQAWEGPPRAVARVDTVDGTWPDPVAGSPLSGAHFAWGETARRPRLGGLRGAQQGCFATQLDRPRLGDLERREPCPGREIHPLSALPQEGAFATEWSGVLYAPQYGSYRFTLRAPAGATLDLDGQTVVVAEEGGQGVGSLALAQGNHSLRVRALSGPGPVSLLWQPPGGRVEIVPQWALYAPPVTPHGLRGSFYGNASWEGPPVLVRVDPFLDTYFHLTPLPRPYSAEWVGTIEIPFTGTYQLGLRAVDWAQLALDGEVVLETGAPGEEARATVPLGQGLHDLRLRFQDMTGRSRLHLLWRPPGQEALTAIPPQALWPAPASDARPWPAQSALPDQDNKALGHR